MKGTPLAFLTASLLACDPAPKPDPQGTKSDPDAVAGETGDGARPTPDPASGPPQPFLPKTAIPTIRVTAPTGECPDLPPPGKDVSEGAARLATILRAFACDPSLYAQPLTAVREKLGLPDGITVTFNAPGGVSVETTESVPVAELAAALGIEKPVARLQWNAYHDSWWLGSNPDTGELDRFGPGVISIGVDLEADEHDPPGKVVPMPAEPGAAKWFGIALPDTQVMMEPDPEGLQQLVAAMRVLADDPARLAKEPTDVERELSLAGERFRVARTSLHSGETKIDGISLQPMRTKIPADEFATALGLEGARAENVNREHDLWNMEVGGTTEFRWEGVTVSVDVEPVDKDDQTTTLVGATVEFVSIRP
jgi:hypothetical protein